jgi:hypothetical protein
MGVPPNFVAITLRSVLFLRPVRFAFREGSFSTSSTSGIIIIIIIIIIIGKTALLGHGLPWKNLPDCIWILLLWISQQYFLKR